PPGPARLPTGIAQRGDGGIGHERSGQPRVRGREQEAEPRVERGVACGLDQKTSDSLTIVILVPIWVSYFLGLSFDCLWTDREELLCVGSDELRSDEEENISPGQIQGTQ